jgi:hypothetical protein
MSATIEEHITKMKTSLKEEADKLKSDLVKDGKKAHLRLSEIEILSFASPSKENTKSYRKYVERNYGFALFNGQLNSLVNTDDTVWET